MIGIWPTNAENKIRKAHEEKDPTLFYFIGFDSGDYCWPIGLFFFFCFVFLSVCINMAMVIFLNEFWNYIHKILTKKVESREM